ncbi:MAG: GDP-mannose 4,6-dehydratase [Spirochaetales bacterium]|nr:GDP-mannose 4,6-dehydratase [Leptospiraceae bacterium]MCP5480086.1 GDP-mannose 4,6-dehydratase [Spirochaetales bacterium]MCP5485573.1 GDP-mannose 4,6-dehydratase [Spirochaetales bacterium]
MKSALVTGLRGFAGKHLCRALLDQGYTVQGIDRQGGATNDVQVIQSDLTDVAELSGLLADFQPDAIFHLAGSAFVPDSWEDPAATLDNNSLRTVNILQAARKTGWKGRFLFVSSSDVYGRAADEEMPLRETQPTRPDTPYALSKLTAEEFALFYLTDAIDVVIARPFNHIGPGQSERFVVPAFLKRIRDAAAAGESTIPVGDIDSVRDFTDVRDVARAYVFLAESGQAGQRYNVCSGRPVSIRQVFEGACKVTGTAVSIRVEEALLRPEGPSARYGSNERLAALGWSAIIPLEQSLADMWEELRGDST